MSCWIRKSELDARIGRDTPVPTEVISNEEYAPPLQTPKQREVERHLEETATRLARRLGMSRRRFLRNALPGDSVDGLKRLSADAGFAQRSNFQYGWVRR